MLSNNKQHTSIVSGMIQGPWLGHAPCAVSEQGGDTTSSAVGRRWVGCGEELGGHVVMHGVVGAWAVLRALQSGGSMSLAWKRADRLAVYRSRG